MNDPLTPNGSAKFNNNNNDDNNNQDDIYGAGIALLEFTRFIWWMNSRPLGGYQHPDQAIEYTYSTWF